MLDPCLLQNEYPSTSQGCKTHPEQDSTSYPLSHYVIKENLLFKKRNKIKVVVFFFCLKLMLTDANTYSDLKKLI